MSVDEINTFLAAMGVDAFNAWAMQRKAEKLEQLSAKEKDLVENYCGDIRGESYEPYVRLFSQIMVNAPQIRLSEEQTKAGGKSFTYYYTVESSVPLIKSGHASELSVVFNHPEMNGFTEEQSTKPSQRPCERCGSNLPRPAIRRLAQTCLLMERHMCGRSTT